MATYEPSGRVETGCFGRVESTREDERQTKLKDDTW